MLAGEEEKKSRENRQSLNKGEQSINQRGEVDILSFNLERYCLNPNDFHFMTDYFYNLFSVTDTRRFRRICVSFISGLTQYLIGLIMAVFIGFATTYITSPVPYLLPLLTSIVMDQLRWAKGPFAGLLNEAREALIINDDQYVPELNKLIRKANDKRPVLSIFLVSLVIWIIVIGVKYFAPGLILSRYTSILIPGTFPAIWFTGPNLLVKWMIAMWLIVIPLLNFAYALYVPATIVSGWHRLVLKWPVVPIPSFISVKFGNFISFYFHALVSYAIAVLVIVVAYGGKFAPPLILLASLFAILGIFCMFFPMYTIYQLVNRAREQVGSAVSKQYFSQVYPLAAGSASNWENAPNSLNFASSSGILLPGVVPKKPAETVDAYLELNKLQELMNNTNEASNNIYRLNLLLPVILSQAIPFLGFLYPLIVSH